MSSSGPDSRQRRWTTPAPAEDDRTEARRELAAALRELLALLPSTGAHTEAIRHATAEVGEITSRLGSHGESDREGEGAIPGMGDYLERGPITGHSNPIAPPFQVWADWEDRVARGAGRFGAAHEGGPGIAHGGFVAAVLDEALGMATIFSGGPGMTGELTIRYRRPTPLHRELVIVARLDEQTGRRLTMSAEMHDGETLIADASALFVAVGDEKFSALDAERRRS